MEQTRPFPCTSVMGYFASQSSRLAKSQLCCSGQRCRASPEYRQQVTWIIVGVVTAVVIPVWLSRRAYRGAREMGSVSGHWLAEYRQNHES
jgi:hypothetical protein